MRYLILICALVATMAAQYSSEPMGTHASPDHALSASVMQSGEAGRTDSESRVEVRDKFGKVLAQQNYSSDDHEHGFGVVKAEWTPDSQFFVFCMESSGGHSPMHTPVAFYSREANKFFEIDDLLNESVAFSSFQISAPDIVTVTFENRKKWKGSLADLISRPAN